MAGFPLDCNFTSKKMKKMKKVIIYIVAFICTYGCSKSEFLNQKPNQSDVVPQSLADYRAILDQDRDVNGMGGTGRGPVPGLGEIGADNYYIPDANFRNLRPQHQNYYRWDEKVYLDYPVFSWNWPYLTVFYANVVLSGLESSDLDSDSQEYRELLGEALFTRAHAFYHLAQVFVPPFDDNNLDLPLGLPLRLRADINEDLKRSTIGETYARIEDDLLRAKNLLSSEPLVKTRASKQAVYGQLARLYLTKRNYESALAYADSCLYIQNELLDYNSLNADDRFPFSDIENNPEIIYLCNMATPTGSPISSQHARINSDLYESFMELDLRKKLFFQSVVDGYTFKGSYSGNLPHFAGIATDEVYLLKAECLARKGDTIAALDELNYLLSTRWHRDEFVPFNTNHDLPILDLILAERQKQLIFRGQRWIDLRRLNQENFQITLKREMDGQEYFLLPNDNKYTWPIPDDVISFYPSMPQNPR